jgi:hypothetical protein
VKKRLICIGLPLLLLMAGVTAASVVDHNWNYLLIGTLYSIVLLVVLCDSIRLRERIQILDNELTKEKSFYTSQIKRY